MSCFVSLRLCVCARVHLCSRAFVQPPICASVQLESACVGVRVHTCACALLNEVFDATSASCSEASGASSGAEMDAANFSIFVRISECVRGGEDERRQRNVGGKTNRERIK